MSQDGQMISGEEAKGAVVAPLQKDQLRAMFYLFTGKPDSRIKVFDSAIHIKPQDIIELNSCVVRKLRTHQIEASTTSVKVGYVGSEFNEFGTWPEFENHHWQESERIEELVVKWDFMMNVQNFAAPQRHTLMFRVSAEMKPGKILQLLSSGNSDEFDNVDVFACPAFCRVDFINAQISKELINVVDDWHKGRLSPQLIPPAYYFFKKQRQLIAEIFDHWMILSWVLFVCALGVYLAKAWYSDLVPVHIAAVYVLFGVYSTRPISRIARAFAGKIFNSLRDLEGSRVVFEFTSGDKRKIAELHQENSRQGRAVISNVVLNLLINICATLIYAWLFTKSGS